MSKIHPAVEDVVRLVLVGMGVRRGFEAFADGHLHNREAAVGLP